MMTPKPSTRLRLFCANLMMTGTRIYLGRAGASRGTDSLWRHGQGHFAELVATFQAQEPDLKINQLLDSKGPIIARLLAEEVNPRADVILGASVPGLVMLEERGMLEPYAPDGLDQIKERFRDARSDPPHWVGTDAWASAICFNTAEGERLGVAESQSWQDLLKPEYKGMITNCCRSIRCCPRASRMRMTISAACRFHHLFQQTPRVGLFS